ncbi:hypothetical protein AXG93_2024s1220 [Marchantia polymorpha subsp. ruderalis]|uniref:Uncharacterized protein n=1 Tax=Marchantia polymorpha subsp. ruderalis TaxID=1480154 RepID=A0A176VJ93_MARPO|nr:hypothetical protein AXG93_2024s1220 [Marchantia polymorpha subsp. ruderalis]
MARRGRSGPALKLIHQIAVSNSPAPPAPPSSFPFVNRDLNVRALSLCVRLIRRAEPDRIAEDGNCGRPFRESHERSVDEPHSSVRPAESGERKKCPVDANNGAAFIHPVGDEMVPRGAVAKCHTHMLPRGSIHARAILSSHISITTVLFPLAKPLPNPSNAEDGSGGQPSLETGRGEALCPRRRNPVTPLCAH